MREWAGVEVRKILVGGAEDQNPARAQHSPHLRREAFRPRQVVDGLEVDHHIEASIWKGQSLGIHFPNCDPVTVVISSECQDTFIDVNAHHAPRATSEVAQALACTACDLEDVLALAVFSCEVIPLIHPRQLCPSATSSGKLSYGGIVDDRFRRIHQTFSFSRYRQARSRSSSFLAKQNLTSSSPSEPWKKAEPGTLATLVFSSRYIAPCLLLLPGRRDTSAST